MINFSFLFDNYAIYPLEIIDNSFVIDDYLYKVEELTLYKEEDVEIIIKFLSEINSLFDSNFKIVKNRWGNHITNQNGKSYVLLSVKYSKISYIDVIKLTSYYLNKTNQKYTITEMINIWEERLNNIRKSCFDSLDSLEINYYELYNIVVFSFGLAENAISYLADLKIDFGDNIDNLSLCHIRLNSYDNYSFFNPFNMIIDSFIRDYAELYKFELIDIYELDKITSKLNLSTKDASLLLARILFPTKVFDLLEDYYLNIKDKINNFSESLEKELQRIKNAYFLLKRKYNVRPIIWLSK